MSPDTHCFVPDSISAQHSCDTLGASAVFDGAGVGSSPHASKQGVFDGAGVGSSPHASEQTS
eukprot:4885222-Alexandrium_andersonii.AAC.1